MVSHLLFTDIHKNKYTKIPYGMSSNIPNDQTHEGLRIITNYRLKCTVQV